MLQSFRHEGLREYWETGNARGLNPQWIKRIRARLVVLDNASSLDEIAIVGWRLHELKGNRRGTWAINLTSNFRMTFRPEIHETDAEQFDIWDVDLEDYHG